MSMRKWQENTCPLSTRQNLVSLVSSHFHTASIVYIELSLFTRLLAYAVDFANAREKLGSLPSWLILHHVGVFAVHMNTAFHFSQSYLYTMIYLLSLQSTHNTWTKKYSLVLYWGNVLLGVILGISCTVMNMMDDDVKLSWASCLAGLLALSTTFRGIYLLAVDCCSNNKKGGKIINKK